ncbi:MAG TPA: isoprenylcysteine carboxylmethyltransferase family protein [Candidatus Limnocylindria bacterium]|nr:isoprenylcysteine carboxylmethyltransferase family protein [Candidatus Limnocylindria bacterium]
MGPIPPGSDGHDPSGRHTRLPALGPHGEGWVVGQAILLVAVAALGIRGLASLPPSDPAGTARVVVGLGLLVVGGLVGLAGLRALGSSLTATPRPKRDAEFVDSGIYARIRHPLYVAVTLSALGWAVATGTPAGVAVALLLAAWLDAKSRREEAWLLEAYPAYAAYRQRTHRFVPGVY